MRIVNALIALMMGCLCLPPAQGGVITFDDLPSINCGGAFMPTTYAGLTWNGWGYDNATVAPCSASGYGVALTTSPNVAFNLAGSLPGAASIVSGTPFNLVSGNFAAAWNDGLTITVVGTLSGTTVGTVNFTVDTTTATYKSFAFGPVTKIDFYSAGGTPNPSLNGSGGYFAVDDVTIDATPEPGTLGLFILAFLVIGIGLKHRSGRYLRGF